MDCPETRPARRWPLALLGLSALLASCGGSKDVNPAPPRVETKAELPQQDSNIVVPVTALLAPVEAGINQRIPRQLWQINKPGERCVPPKKVKVFGKKVNVTPLIKCDIVGQVTRGAIKLVGNGNTLSITMPVSARISARDVGGIIKSETATGAAVVRATANVSVDRSWAPQAKVRIAYDWTNPPGIDFLGKRITFVDKADTKLAQVIAGIEREIPKEIAKIQLRQKLAALWPKAFTSIQLNRTNPEVWMRITPRALGFGGVRFTGGRIDMTLMLAALTETFVSARPPDPEPTPLPSVSPVKGPHGLNFFIPVLADFRELEPVVEKALAKTAAKGITLPGVGAVDAEFSRATIYATTGGRIAIGIKAKVTPQKGVLGSTSGVVWLSAVPYNEANGQLVRVRDLQIAGQTDRKSINLLWTLFQSPEVIESIRGALSHNFVRDYEKVLTKAREAIANRREGDFLLAADVKSVSNGLLKVTGEGLFLPVMVQGEANILYAPQ